jgi:hypothetical protein
VKRANQILDWTLEKHFTMLMVTMVLAGATILMLLAFPATTDVASGWWQVAIEIVGLPILVHQLYQIRKALQQKPRISIGLVPGEVTATQLKKKDGLPTTQIDLSRRGKSDFTLVIQNYGQLAAKSVMIRLEYTPYKGDSPPALMRPSPGSRFKVEVDGNSAFRGGEDWVLYSLSSETFTFSIGYPSQTGMFLLVQKLELGDHHLRCTVWADGLEPAATEDLVVQIIE